MVWFVVIVYYDFGVGFEMGDFMFVEIILEWIVEVLLVLVWMEIGVVNREGIILWVLVQCVGFGIYSMFDQFEIVIILFNCQFGVVIEQIKFYGFVVGE